MATDQLQQEARVLALLHEAQEESPPGSRLQRAVRDATRAVTLAVRYAPAKFEIYKATRRSVSGKADSIPPSPDLTLPTPGEGPEGA